MHIHWFPGHMTKSLRMMDDNVKLMDMLIYVLDARAPIATYNPNLKKIFGNKPVLYLLNKVDLADVSKALVLHLRLNKSAVHTRDTHSSAAVHFK